MRVFGLVYGAIAYFIFFAAFVYAVGFVGNIAVPRSIDTGMSGSGAIAWIVDAALLSVFAVQHSLMARPFFKRWWTRIVPRAIERSTYVVFASLALFLIYWQWIALPQTVWLVTAPVGSMILRALFWAGWATVFISTFLINHFDLFGLQQVWDNFRGRQEGAMQFRTPLFYRVVRHPIYLGFTLAFWATPSMSVGHLLFAVATTGYMLIAIQFEEHDLIGAFGASYIEYKRRVSMIIPLPPRRR
ncbi:MAG: methanethiol S-methyltransferase [Rhizomicrobium sp.]|jgi:protein-S-isoprenylcysteine O-methyltransferase Ste14